MCSHTFGSYKCYYQANCSHWKDSLLCEPNSRPCLTCCGIDVTLMDAVFYYLHHYLPNLVWLLVVLFTAIKRIDNELDRMLLHIHSYQLMYERDNLLQFSIPNTRLSECSQCRFLTICFLVMLCIHHLLYLSTVSVWIQSGQILKSPKLH